MINALLTKVGNLFEKEFLFGSFLPALIFAAACVATVAGTLGFEASLSWAALRGPIDKALYPAVAAIGVVVFAYVLSGIRPLVVRFWSGEAFPLYSTPLGNVMTTIARKNFLVRRKASLVENPWAKIADWLQAEAMAKWTVGKTAANAIDVDTRLRALSVLSRMQSLDEVKELVKAEFLDKLDVFAGTSMSSVYEHLKRLFLDWRASEQQRLGAIWWELDRSYGSPQHIRATRLGNRIQSYIGYSFSRYGIESEILWPHLQTQIDTKCKEALVDARALLDFALNLATLGVAYFVLCVFAGPWLDWSTIWFFLAAAGIAGAVTGYQIALIAADQFGGVFRASFDLYRLNLLTALHRTAPKKLEDERAMWKEVSQLLLYGQSTNFELTPVSPPLSSAVTA